MLRLCFLSGWPALVLLFPSAGVSARPELDASETTASRQLGGVVCDDNGRPLANASVWLVDARPESRIRMPEVLDKAKTDAAGHFQLAVPGDCFKAAHPWRRELALVAHQPGRRVAGLILDRGFMPPQSGIKITLGAPAQAAFQLVRPDGKPVVGCQVTCKAILADRVRGPKPVAGEGAPPVAIPPCTPEGRASRAVPGGRVLIRDLLPVPSELAKTISASCDAQGRVTLPDLALADLAGIRVIAPDFGCQEFMSFVNPWIRKKKYDPWPDHLSLKPVGKLVGRVNAQSASALAGIRVYVRSSEDIPDSGIWPVGVAEITTDSDGRFEAPAIAAGDLFTELDLPADSNVLSQTAGGRPANVKAGETATVTILLKPAVRVNGMVRERRTGRPLPHVQLATYLRGHSSLQARRPLETGADGRFSFVALPGPIQWQAIYGPEVSALSPQESYAFRREVPPDLHEYEMPALELPILVTVRGTVTDDASQPASGATVTAVKMIYDYHSKTMRPDVAQVTADAQGSFTLDRVDLDRGVRLKARHGAAGTERAVVLKGDELTKPIALRIVSGLNQAGRGRVADEAGRPLANVEVEIWWRPWTPALIDFLPQPLTLAAGGGMIPQEAMPHTLGWIPETRLALDKALRTDADGRFEIPKILDADGEYQAVVRAAGFVPAHTAWKRLVPGQVLQWKEVQLGILRSLEGQVVDRRGQPVPGAKVVRSDSRSVERATTDAAGHFNLNIVVDRPGFVFAEARGFRFHGQVNDNTRPVRVTLVRSDETVGSPMKMLPLKLSKLERHALAEKLIEPQLNRGLAKDDDGERFWWLEWLAATDPARVLEMLEKRPLHEVQYDGLVRRTVAKRLVKESLEEARTVVDSIRDAGQRAEVYLELFDALSWERSEERKTLLAQVLLNARAIGAADQLTYYSGRVADRLLTVGDRKRGAEIIQETLESARKLPMVGTPGYYRTSYATCLSRFDLPAALELIKDLPDSYQRDEQYGAIASRIAGDNPADAERVLEMVGHPARRDSSAIRVCYRMARQDRDRARRIADQCKYASYRAEAYGAMAYALAKSDKKLAMRTLRRAFDILSDQAAQDQDQRYFSSSYDRAPTMLLPLAERLEPESVTELFWRTVSFRIPRSEDDETEVAYARGSMADAALAFTLARYDRTVPRLLLEDTFSLLIKHFDSGGNDLVHATAMVDPAEALRLIDLCSNERRRDGIRQELARLLLRDEDGLWRRPGQFVPDEEK